MDEQRKSESELVPALRFEGFTDPWEQRKLGEIAHRVTRKNEEGASDLPLTISAQHGLVDQRDFFGSQVASRDMRGCYLLEKGEFAYNKSTSGDSPWGAVKRLARYEKGCLSTLYICFGLDVGDPSFLVTYYETNRWHKGIRLIAAEGARNHGLLNIAPRDFFETELTLPGEIEEQSRIGALFARLDSLIALHQRKYEKLKTVKQSLLEKMFPKEGEDVPELRFEGFTDPWEQRKLGELFAKGGSGGTPTATEPSYYNGEIPFLGIADIEDRYIDSTAKSLTEDGLNNSAAWVVPSGAICLAMYASVGKVGICELDLATSQAFYNMVFDSQALRDYVYARLDKADANAEWEPLISTGTQANLNAEKVKGFQMAVPCCEEADLVGSFFRGLDSLIALHQRELEILKNLKKALLEKMFV